MAPQGYADGLLKPANQVRAQKNLVKAVPGSNLPRQPAKAKREQLQRIVTHHALPHRYMQDMCECAAHLSF